MGLGRAVGQGENSLLSQLSREEEEPHVIHLNYNYGVLPETGICRLFWSQNFHILDKMNETLL